jgi:GntR family transcriptional regulator
MPTEAELQQTYGVSRYCARAALQQLKDSGMVSARAGIGRAVMASEPVHDRYMQGSTTLADLVQSVDTTLHVVQARDAVVDAAMSERTGFAAGARIVEVTALRTKVGTDVPTALLFLTLRSGHAMMARYMEGETEPFHMVLEKRYGVLIDAVQQRIVAVHADAKSARLLQASAHEPCLRNARRFLDDQQEVIFSSIGFYPGDRFSHDTAFKVRR